LLHAAKSRGIILTHPDDKDSNNVKRQEAPQAGQKAVVTVYRTVGGPSDPTPAVTPAAQPETDAYDKWLADAKQEVQNNNVPQGMTAINDGR